MYKRQINEVFSTRGINIDGQYLRTSANLGYVVIDIAPQREAPREDLRAALAAVPGTLRTRILY